MPSDFLPLIFLYPELHYRFKYFPFSRYYIKEPEVLIDLPYKSSSGEFPVFMIVKDAHIFPLTVWSVKFHFVFEDGSAFVKTFVINEKIDKHMYYKQFDFSFPEKKGFTGVSALFNVYSKGSLKTIVNDNISGIDPELEIYLDDNEELFENHIQGDLHYHSEFTSDQVEFGGPVKATKKCAETLGLNFFALTDHSYDLDDMEYDYLRNDPDLNKFKQMKLSADENSDDKVTILDGQEVTVRNSKERNVHILVYNQEYFEGSGDSAEKWFSTKSENSIFDIKHKMSEDSLAVAAHPFNKIPFLEYLFVKRGRWNKDDIIRNSVSHLQILNGDFDDNFFNNLSAWTELLLSGERIFITAGNDAHGNFNVFRQIKFPMLKISCRYKQIFGKCRTVVLCSSAKRQDIIKTVKEGKCYITNGPHFILNVRNKNRVYSMGELFSVKRGELEAEIFINSSQYSGSIRGAVLYRGSIHSSEERIIWKKEFTEEIYSFDENVDLLNDNIDHYIRLEVFTSSTHWNGKNLEHRAYSNPIWIMK